jgi:hypothetical protein
LVWRKGSEFFCDLTATTYEPVLFGPSNVFIVDGIEDRSLIGEKGAKSGDYQGLKIGGGYAPST